MTIGSPIVHGDPEVSIGGDQAASNQVSSSARWPRTRTDSNLYQPRRSLLRWTSESEGNLRPVASGPEPSSCANDMLSQCRGGPMRLPDYLHQVLKLGWGEPDRFRALLQGIVADLERPEASPSIDYLEPYEALGAVDLAAQQRSGYRGTRDDLTRIFREMMNVKGRRREYVVRAHALNIREIRELERTVADWRGWDTPSQKLPDEVVEVTTDDLLRFNILHPFTNLVLASRGFRVVTDEKHFVRHTRELAELRTEVLALVKKSANWKVGTTAASELAREYPKRSPLWWMFWAESIGYDAEVYRDAGGKTPRVRSQGE